MLMLQCSALCKSLVSGHVSKLHFCEFSLKFCEVFGYDDDFTVQCPVQEPGPHRVRLVQERAQHHLHRNAGKHNQVGYRTASFQIKYRFFLISVQWDLKKMFSLKYII